MLRLFVATQNVYRDVQAALKGVAGNESGATAIEYGLIAAGIAVAIIAVVFALGGDIKNFFSSTQNAIASAGQ